MVVYYVYVYFMLYINYIIIIIYIDYSAPVYFETTGYFAVGYRCGD